MHVISLGAGVQSSTMALMAAHGEITPMPEAAIFADTQAEPAAVYEWLEWLTKQLPFPVEKVTAGNLAESASKVRTSKNGGHYVKTSIPSFIEDPTGSIGLGMRGCTKDFKIVVIERKLRELRAGRRVIQWIGISWDEVHRMKGSRVLWKEHIWPLIDRRMTRQDCKNWMMTHEFPEPPRSACVFCPFHNDSEWQRLKTQDPEGFAAAVKFEKLHQIGFAATSMKGTPYLHRSCRPLDQVSFNGDEPGQLNLFGNECEGMCGV